MVEVEELLQDQGLWEIPEDKLEEIEVMELEEYLDNLGYISINQNDDDRIADWTAIVSGIQMFRDEYLANFNFFHAQRKIFPHTYPRAVSLRAAQDELTEEELDFLEHLCSIEGDFALHEFSQQEIADNQILCRVLNYRLSVLGLLHPKDVYIHTDATKPAIEGSGKWVKNIFVYNDEAVNDEIKKKGRKVKNVFVYDEAINPTLEKLGKWANVVGYKKQLELCGDIHHLTRTLVNLDDYDNNKYCHIVYFKDQKHHVPDEEGKKKRQKRKYFWSKRGITRKEQFKSRFVLLPEAGKKAYKKRNKAKEIEAVIHDELHTLMCRLVQIKLWLLGTYDGQLDSDIGQISIDAVHGLVEFIHELHEKVIGEEVDNSDRAIWMSDLINVVKNPIFGSKYWALNVSFLFRHVFPILIDKYNKKQGVDVSTAEIKTEAVKGGKEIIDNSDKQAVENTTVAGEIGRLSENLKEEDKKHEDEIYQAINDEVEGKPDPASSDTAQVKRKRKRRRKVKTRGGKDFFRSIKLFFGKIIKGIAAGIKAIVRAIKNLFRWIKTGIKILLREIKKVFALLRKSIQFVFGKRIITTTNAHGSIVTDYDFDFDSMTYFAGDKTKIPIEQHLQKNRAILSALQETSNFLGTVFYFAINIGQPIFGWIKMGIKLINFLTKSNFKFQRFTFPIFTPQA